MRHRVCTVSRKTLLPKIETIHCRECIAFHKEASAKLREREFALEQAFDSHDIAQIEQEFDTHYMSIFRAWMDHKTTHETGSLRKFVEQFRAQQPTAKA